MKHTKKHSRKSTRKHTRKHSKKHTKKTTRTYRRKQKGGESDFLVTSRTTDSEPIYNTKTPVATMGQVLPLDVLKSRVEQYDGMNPVA